MIVQEGKRYIMRNGSISARLKKNPHDLERRLGYVFSGGRGHEVWLTTTYTLSGKVFDWDSDSEFDLMEEYVEEIIINYEL